MKGVQRVELGTLLQVTQALEAVVGPCFGPSGGQVLFTRDSGEVLITRDGRRILTSLRLDHPVASSSSPSCTLRQACCPWTSCFTPTSAARRNTARRR
ncbi:hypothetical protein ANANG_G00308200, partial [Anguilla anguilla]